MATWEMLLLRAEAVRCIVRSRVLPAWYDRVEESHAKTRTIAAG